MNIITDTINEIRKMRVRKVWLWSKITSIVFAARSQLRHDHLFGTDDLENPDDSDKHWESRGRCAQVRNSIPPPTYLLSLITFYSGSMEPSYYRGDILFLVRREQIVPGDIIVYSIQNEAIPIVHRVTTV